MIKKTSTVLFILLNILYSEVFEGLTIATAKNNPNILMVENSLDLINSWNNDTAPYSIAYLNRDSTLYVPCKIPGYDDSQFAGRFKKVTWDGEIIWDYILPQEICKPHHDIAILPNNNILAICTEEKSHQEAESAGFVGIDGPFELDMIVEIEPIGNNNANIVWKWHFWDHLIQDVNPNLNNYGIISEHPELLDINVNGTSGNGNIDGVRDWNHCNSISYNKKLNQIVISSRKMDEFYVIDHSTTMQEAATSQGGIYGKGGDFLYRWGNPENYNRGTANNQILFDQHGVDWIPDGYIGAGNFLIFNNNHSPGSSAVLEIENVADENGFYTITNDQPFAPNSYDWIYQSDFYSGSQSGAFRLSNGNTIITSAVERYVFEVTYDKELVWEYYPNSAVSRAIKYPYNYLNYTLGDLSNDEELNILDIILIIEIIINENTFNSIADINLDHEIDILDAIQMINLILS